MEGKRGGRRYGEEKVWGEGRGGEAVERFWVLAFYLYYGMRRWWYAEG